MPTQTKARSRKKPESKAKQQTTSTLKTPEVKIRARAKTRSTTRESEAPTEKMPKAEQLKREGPQKKEGWGSWLDGKLMSMPGIALFAIMVVIMVSLAILYSNADNGTQARGPLASPIGNPAQQADALAQAQAKYAHLSYRGFRTLAGPHPVNHHQKGRFIYEGINHMTPAEQYEAFLKASAEDRVSLVGFLQELTNGKYPATDLQRIMGAKHGGRIHYKGWKALRDLFKPMDAKEIRNTRLNGQYWNLGLGGAGVVTASQASYHNEPATRLAMPAAVVHTTTGGTVYVPARRVWLKHVCGNAQVKQRPSFAVPSKTPGKTPTVSISRHPPVTDAMLNRGGLPNQQGTTFGSNHRVQQNSPQDSPPGTATSPPTGGSGAQDPGSSGDNQTSPPPTQDPTPSGDGTNDGAGNPDGF